MGPGRPRCGGVGQGACPQEAPYDGLALPRGLFPSGSNAITVEVHAYGQSQPAMNIAQRVLVQLMVRLHDGKMLTLATGDGNWEAFDAVCVSCGCVGDYVAKSSIALSAFFCVGDWHFKIRCLIVSIFIFFYLFN